MGGDPESTQPRYAGAKIEARLAEDPRVAELGIQVSVRPARVFLRGSVTSDQRREVAGQLAHELMPGAEIHNELVVVAGEEPDATEDLPWSG